jgi:CDP-glucose 4,6-dehydratase
MDQVVNPSFKEFFNEKKVFITGHTGFKGAWLCLLLSRYGAKVFGYSVDFPTEPNMFSVIGLDQYVTSTFADIRNLGFLKRAIEEAQPDIVIHMAAQPLVRDSYKIPVETYAINVMGTVNLLEACRGISSIRSIVNVTTDKTYENKEWCWGYRENEPMNGYDPYSNSKSCSELVTSAYRNSYFNPLEYAKHKVGLASARAGNVIGGGDWANDRLIVDCVKSLSEGEKVSIRYPSAIRPWQHVLEPLSGYLLLAQKLYEEGAAFSSGWNFGPNDSDAQAVKYVVEGLCSLWGDGASYLVNSSAHLHEANYLKLDCSKARQELGWTARWNLDTALKNTVEWYKAYSNGMNMYEISCSQIDNYFDNLK